MLGVRAQGRAEFSTDYHLVVALYEFQNLGHTENRVGPMWLTGSNGRPGRTEMRGKFASSMAAKFL